MTDLVARAEVFLELAGDDPELFARPLECTVRVRQLNEREDQDDRDQGHHDGQHTGSQDHDRRHRDDEDRGEAGELEARLLHEGEDLVEVGHNARGDVAGQLAVVVVHTELAQAVEDTPAQYDDHALVEPLRKDPEVLRHEADADRDEHEDDGPEVRGAGVGSVAVLDDVGDPAEEQARRDASEREEEHEEERHVHRPAEQHGDLEEARP